MKFDTSGRRGMQIERVRVQTNDPQSPEVLLMVKAFIETEFWLEERGIHLGRLNVRDSFDRRIKIGAKDTEKLSIESFKPSHPDIKAELIWQDEGGKRIPYLRLSGGPGLPVGRLHRWVEVIFDSQKNIHDRVIILAHVTGDLKLSPERIRLGNIEGEYRSEGKLFVYSESGKPFKILHLQETSGNLSFEVLPFAGETKYRITVRERENVQKGRKSTTLTIHTDREGENLLQVPVLYYIKGKE